MTGFGDASAEHDGVHYFVEVRSLNNKYLKVVLRIPEELQSLEADLESAIRRRLSRGTVTISVKCTDVSGSAALEINRAALDRYVEQLEGAGSVSSGKVAMDLAPLLALPGVLQKPTDDERRISRARGALKPLLQEACDHLISMRVREGLLLKDELDSHGRMIAENLKNIAGRAPQVVADYEQRLRTRIEALMKDSGVELQPAELVREIAIYAEKTDIAEEVSRLSGHIDQFGDLLGAEDDRPIGRTLDFLAQEMLREANTIASKSPDSMISRMTVEVKGAIDRIKEQAQNVE